MNIRLLRLQNDLADMKQLPRLTGGRVQFVTEGDPPTRYVVTYAVKGVIRRPDGEVEVQDRFEVEFILPDEYPRSAPIVTTRQPIWHPNFWTNRKVCVDAEHFAAGQGMAELVIRVGEMIQYQQMNLADPANIEAAQWAKKNPDRLPIDPTVLQCGARPQVDAELDDGAAVVELGGISRLGEDEDEIIVSVGELVRDDPADEGDAT